MSVQGIQSDLTRVGAGVFLPKLMTSNTFAVPSSATLANNCPSALAETATIGAKCAR